jgi:hypothetical protein
VYICVYKYVAVLDFELMALYLLGRRSTT